MYSQSSLSLKQLFFKVEDRFGQKDPTTDPVVMAFMPAGVDPASGDFKTCSWFTDTSGTHYAVALVGPGSPQFALGKGVYLAWLKFTDSPEVPADPVAPITIT